jgi:glycosyltransferase involved in cell wall biosynthesis
VADLLPGLDLFTLTSQREGLPLALLEALASGVPAIATAVGEIPQVLSEGAGITVPPGDPATLAWTMARAALDPAWRRTAGASARELVGARYSMAAMADGYVHFYRAALHARRAA